MYLEHFGLREAPFRITPHTDFFFDGAERGATLDALGYAVLHEEGIVKVGGEVGSGKTMLCRVLMERLPSEAEIVYLADPSLSRDEIVHAIAEELKLELADGRFSVALRELQEQLIQLYAEGRRVVILIDEAHAMPAETLEQVRLLSNLESSRHKLLQIVLFGQSELDDTLAAPSMRQLKDRITHNFRMRPLDAQEVGKYLTFRMRAAGYRGPDVFTPRAVAMIARASKGLTRRVNILADKSLLAAFSEDRHAVTPRQVRKAIADSEFGSLGRPRRTAAYVAAALLAGAALGIVMQWGLRTREAAHPPAPAAPRPGTSSPAPPAPAVPAAAIRAPAARSQSAPAPAAPASSALAPSAPAGPADPAARTAQETPVARATAPPASSPAPEAHPSLRLEVPLAEGSPAQPPRSLLAEAQIRRIANYTVGPHPLLRERIEAASALLASEPGASYSLELFVTSNTDPARVERFLIRARDLVPLTDLYVIPMASAGGYRLAVVYGIYPSREAAARAVEHLPPKYNRAFQPVPRSLAALRRAT
jgi:MSHA biogenesis protein MshM